MARAHLRQIAHDRLGNVVANAAVYLFAVGTGVETDPPTGTAITGSMYAARTGGAPITNKLISNANGEVEAWLDTPQTMDAVVTNNGNAATFPDGTGYPALFSPFKEVVHAYHDPADVGGGGGGAPTTADYLVGTAQAGLSAEIVAGATPGGELGGTWGNPTVDGVHSGSSHHPEIHDIDGATHDGFPGGTTNFLRADGAFAAPPGGGGGAPTDALYIVTAAHASLSAEKVLGTDVVVRGTAAAKPATPAFDGQLYIETDGSRIVWRGNGTASWDEIARGEPGIRLAQLAERLHSSLGGLGANDHHPEPHALGTGAGVHTHSGGAAGRFLRETGAATYAFEAIAFSRGGTLLDPAGARDIMVWRAPFACTVTNVRGHRKGGTGATINARRNQASDHLAANLSLGTADAWADGGAVQNTAYTSGDDLEIRVVSITGAVTEIAIQVDYSRP